MICFFFYIFFETLIYIEKKTDEVHSSLYLSIKKKRKKINSWFCSSLYFFNCCQCLTESMSATYSIKADKKCELCARNVDCLQKVHFSGLELLSAVDTLMIKRHYLEYTHTYSHQGCLSNGREKINWMWNQNLAIHHL